MFVFFVASCDEALLTFYFVIVPLSSADPGCDCFQSGLYAFSAFCPPLGVAIESRCWGRSSGLISEIRDNIRDFPFQSVDAVGLGYFTPMCCTVQEFLFLNWIVFHFSVFHFSGPSSHLKSRDTEEFSGLHLTRINIKEDISSPMSELWCSCFTLDIRRVKKKIRGRSISACLSPSSGKKRLMKRGFSFSWWESILFHWERAKQNKIK